MGQDYSGYDLSGLDLRNANLSRAILRGTDEKSTLVADSNPDVRCAAVRTKGTSFADVDGDPYGDVIAMALAPTPVGPARRERTGSAEHRLLAERSIAAIDIVVVSIRPFAPQVGHRVVGLDEAEMATLVRTLHKILENVRRSPYP